MSEQVPEVGDGPTSEQPVVPRPAASVVLLRRGGRHGQRELEVLMLRRTERARFMPGLWVFPGGAVDPGDGEGEGAYRCCAVRELAEETEIELPAGEELVPFCRWITPEGISIRYDAWFYLALAPAHTPPQPDGAEIVAAAWRKPAEALAAHEAGELPLAFPTRHQLRWLLPFRTSDEAIASFRGRSVEPVLPRVLDSEKEPRIVLPGEPGYDS